MQFLIYSGDMGDSRIELEIAETCVLLEAARTCEDAIDVVEAIREAQEHLDIALNEAMATAVVEGASMRSVAQAAEMAPNSVRSRLAASPLLADYSMGGVVDAMGVAEARFEKNPMTFTRRRPTKES